MSEFPRAIDFGADQFAKFAEEIDWRKIFSQAAEEIAITSRQQLPPSSAILSGEDAAAYLEKLIPLVEQLLLSNHQAYGRVRWLWYLRRMPDELFSGRLNTTLGYDRAITENLSWYCFSKDPRPLKDRVAFRVDASAFRHACRFIAKAKYLSQLHSIYRCIGKGATLDVSLPFPIPLLAPEVDTAVKVYDMRHDRSNELSLSGLGLAAAGIKLDDIDNEDHELPVFLILHCKPIEIPVEVPTGDGKMTTYLVTARHAVNATAIKKILKPFGKGFELTPVIRTHD